MKEPYLLVQSDQLSFTQNARRSYKIRLNPLGHREARLRDSLPGLPDIIHIDSLTQQTLDFLEGLSSAHIWHNTPASVQQPADGLPPPITTQPQQPPDPSPVPNHTTPNLPPSSRRPQPTQESSLRARSSYGIYTNSDDQTASTHSAMPPSKSGAARIHDLESQMKQLHCKKSN